MCMNSKKFFDLKVADNFLNILVYLVEEISKFRNLEKSLINFLEFRLSIIIESFILIIIFAEFKLQF